MRHVEMVGTEKLLKNVVVFGGGFLKQVNNTMDKCIKVLDFEVTKNMTLTCHTLEALAKLGHPYSALTPFPLHPVPVPGKQTFEAVHVQTGRLYKGKFKRVSKAGFSAGKLISTGWVGISGVPYAYWVIHGSSRMIKRDFLGGSLHIRAKEIRGIWEKGIRDAITGEGIRRHSAGAGKE